MESNRLKKITVYFPAHQPNAEHTHTIEARFVVLKVTNNGRPIEVTPKMRIPAMNIEKELLVIEPTGKGFVTARWIAKYTELMEKYLEKITPQVSDTWRADEMFLKVKGNLKYLYALMDDQTRFWIAQEVANTKYTADVRPLLQIAKQIAGKQPKTFITDGAANFHEAYLKEFYTRKLENRTEHIRHIRLAGDRNNNRMERFNGEVRDREEVMRGLERKDSPILTGYQIYHNYIKPHKALENRTPAEAAGIEVKGKNRWLTLIQNAKAKSDLSQV